MAAAHCLIDGRAIADDDDGHVALRAACRRQMVCDHDIGPCRVCGKDEPRIGAVQRAQRAAAQLLIIDGKRDGYLRVAHVSRSIGIHAVGLSPRVTLTLISEPEREMSILALWPGAALRSIPESARTEAVVLPSKERMISPCCSAERAAGPFGSRLMIMRPVLVAASELSAISPTATACTLTPR